MANATPLLQALGGFTTNLGMKSRLSVKVVPGASQSKIAGLLGDSVKIRVQAPPEKGKANEAVLSLLAKFLGVSVNQLSICTGHTSANKVIEVQGVSDAELTTKLSQLAT